MSSVREDKSKEGHCVQFGAMICDITSMQCQCDLGAPPVLPKLKESETFQDKEQG